MMIRKLGFRLLDYEEEMLGGRSDSRLMMA